MKVAKIIVPLACLVLAGVVHGAALDGRPVPPKPDAVIRPAHASELIVKFRDAAKVRAQPQGLVSLATHDLADVGRIQRELGVTFSPLIKLPEPRLAFLEQRAAQASGIAQPDFAGVLRVHANADRLQRVADALLALDVVEYVEFHELTPPPPCADVAPITPDYVIEQDYRGPDPGINMDAAWTLGDTRGAGVVIADCEYGFNEHHEDLCDVLFEPGQAMHPTTLEDGWDEHGTAVFGELLSLDADGYGCVGLVPDAEGLFFPEKSAEEGSRRVTAIANAIATVGPGDIVVLEMQALGAGGAYGPAEYSYSVWQLVKNATDSCIIVVAAAGNGSQDLDSPAYESYRNRGDSGAIIVGAGTADTSHDRLSFSTYGERVNLQGWGESVFTLGYGTYATHGDDENQKYTSGFTGTSSATPMVAAACVALQSYADARLGRRLTPEELRTLLIETGVPQGSGGHIGPLPDVYAAALAIETLACPADIDGDATVGFTDLTRVLSAWGDCPVGCAEDLDEHDRVGFGDLAIVLGSWGPCP